MFEPENDLERSLLRAVSDPAHRPNFLLRMFNAEIIIALEIEGAAPSVSRDGGVTAPPGSKAKLRIMRDGHQEYIPLFTALSRTKATNNGQAVFASVQTFKVLERNPGRHFVLNPGHEHAQKFSSDDVKGMLAGQFGVPVAAVASTQAPASQKQPAAQPTGAAAALATPQVSTKPPAAELPEPKAAEPAQPAVSD